MHQTLGEMIAEQSSRNTKANYPKQPLNGFKLRWYSYKYRVRNPNSWLEGGPATFITETKPVLQYSTDGLKWFDVEYFTEDLT